MTSRRSPQFDLDQALRSPSFTPRRSDIPALLERVAAGQGEAALAERALARMGADAGHAAVAYAGDSAAVGARMLRVIGKIAACSPDQALAAHLAGQLGAPDVQTRRAAAVALGKARPPGAEAALGAALARESATPVRRALIEALGKVGGPDALALLERECPDDPAAARARLMLSRTISRPAAAPLDAARGPDEPLPVALRCRAGLEPLLLDELGELEPALAPRLVTESPGGPHIAVTLAGPLSRLLAARTLLSAAFVLPRVAVPAGQALEPALVAALTSAAARRVFAGYGSGPVRYRLAWARGGKRRAVIWQVAQAVQRQCPDLVNDPTDSQWTVMVYEPRGALHVELLPRIADARFAYRRRDVPAASHPTVAAALARAGGVRPEDVVWDPFVGSGLELCERSLLGPYRLLMGSDVAAQALDIAAENLASAGVAASRRALLVGDAATLVPPRRPTLILSNPPLGRRVQRTAALGSLLERFVAHAARQLVPGGRLVWISPQPGRTTQAARRAGLRLTRAHAVDMGGFVAELQMFVR